MNEIEQFEHFMALADAYHEQHPNQEHFFNYFQYVPIDLLIAILENAHGRIVRMDCENAKGKVGFKGFSYVLPSNDLDFELLSLSDEEVDVEKNLSVIR